MRADSVDRLANLIAGAQTDDDQLRVLADLARNEVAVPADAFVVGEPVQVTAIEYDGRPRRGLTASCRRDDEQGLVSLVDVAFPPGSGGAAFVLLYRAWIGLGEQPMSARSSTVQTRRHRVTGDDIELGRPLDLIVLACKSNALRCRVPGTARELTLRTAVRDEVPGEIVTVIPTKQWTHAGHPYSSGTVQSSRLDVAALGLPPLELRAAGEWDPDDEYWGEADDPLPEWAVSIIARGTRPLFEMEEVIPGADPEDFDSDPIIAASELHAGGARAKARELLMGLLAQDLRCVDAHAHLGNFEFERRPAQALRHYAVGVGIGALTLGEDFDGVLAWGLIDNRPYLRCMQGLGLSLWWLGKDRAAAATFRRMLLLNPSDNQGARFNLAAVEAGRTWEEMEEDEA